MHAHIRRMASAGLVPAAAMVFLAFPASTFAQLGDQIPAWEGRGFINVSGGLQLLTGSFTDRGSFADFRGPYITTAASSAALQESVFNSRYHGDNGPAFDVSAGHRAYRNFGIGIGFSRFAHDQATSITAQVPHPLYHDEDRYREFAGEAQPVLRTETAVHLQALVVVPATSSFTATIFGGPTFFKLNHGLVSDVSFTHEYPYDTAEFAGAVSAERKRAKAGFNGGVDLAYYLSDTMGVGVLARYSQAKVHLKSTHGGDPVEIQVGGLHVVGGLRIRF